MKKVILSITFFTIVVIIIKITYIGINMDIAKNGTIYFKNFQLLGNLDQIYGFALNINESKKINDYNARMCDNNFCYYPSILTRVCRNSWCENSIGNLENIKINNKYETSLTRELKTLNNDKYIFIKCISIDCELKVTKFLNRNFIVVDFNSQAKPNSFSQLYLKESI